MTPDRTAGTLRGGGNGLVVPNQLGAPQGLLADNYGGGTLSLAIHSFSS